MVAILTIIVVTVLLLTTCALRHSWEKPVRVVQWKEYRTWKLEVNFSPAVYLRKTFSQIFSLFARDVGADT